MATKKKEKQVVILNGTRMWLTFIMFVIGHGSVGVWWASSVNTRVGQVEKQQIAIEQRIEKVDSKIDVIIKEMIASRAVQRSS